MPNINKIIIAVIAFLLFSCSSTSLFKNDSLNTTSLENVSFTQQNEFVHITYDLIATSKESLYHVHLLLDLEDAGRYAIDPESVSGDVGSNIAPGREKEIVWDVLRDFPQGLERNQIQFAVTVQPDRQPNRNWVYVSGTAILLSAGVLIGVMLVGGGSSGDKDTGLPPPPSRPGM